MLFCGVGFCCVLQLFSHTIFESLQTLSGATEAQAFSLSSYSKIFSQIIFNLAHEEDLSRTEYSFHLLTFPELNPDLYLITFKIKLVHSEM